MADRFTSPREIIQLNIDHYTQLLRTALDEQTRLTVEALLAAEKAKLARLGREGRNDDAGDQCAGARPS